jgi:LmbE family N-acetylglucosaminyl deacetylase
LTLSDFRQSWVRRILPMAADLTEPFWGFGFWLTGLVKSGHPSFWHSTGDKKVLVLAPHPDDEVGGCAGTIRLHKNAGDKIWVLVVTDGRLAASLFTPEELAQQRRIEVECATTALEIDKLEWAGFEEGSLWVAALIGKLRAILEEYQPDIIYTTSRIDFHPDHHRTAFALARVLESSETAPVIRIYQVHVPLTGVLANLVANVTGEEAAVRAAIGCYTSQWWHMGRTQRMRRYAARYYQQGRYAETFWEMTRAQFCKMHEMTAEFDKENKHWSLTKYSGMRYFSWRDPLAYLKGRRHRLELQRSLENIV